MTDLAIPAWKGSSYRYIVFLEGGSCKALNNTTGVIESVNTDAKTVIQYAITNGAGVGGIFIKAGSYSISAAITLLDNTMLRGEGARLTKLTPSGNFNILQVGGKNGCIIEGISFEHAQSGLTTSLIQITNNSYHTEINDCQFWDNVFNSANTSTATQVGFAISVENAGTTISNYINETRIVNCYSFGFQKFLYISIPAAGTASFSVAPYVQDCRCINCKIDFPVKALDTNVNTNNVTSRVDFISCNIETNATLDTAAFDYDDSGSHLYVNHVDTVAWDLVAPRKYAALGANMGVAGVNYANFIGCTPIPSFTGAGATTTRIGTEWAPTLTETMTNKTVQSSILSDSSIRATHTTGFENIITFTLDNASGDSFTVDNNSNVSGVFAPLFRATMNSTSAAATDTALWMQGIIKVANDTGTQPCFVFSAKRADNTAIATRPIISFYNLFTSILDVNATNVDFKGNMELKNAIVDSAANTTKGFLVSPLSKHTGYWMPAGGTTVTTIGNLNGLLGSHTPTGAGSNTNTYDTTNGVLGNFVTGTTAGNAAGLVSPTAGVGVGRRLFAMRALIRASISATTTSKFLFGFTSNATLPTAAATQPLAATDHGVIVGFVETGTGSTNWTIWHNDGATSVTADNVTGPIAKDTNFHTIEINWPASGNVVVIFDGVSQTISADLPATTANLFFNAIGSITSTTARTFSVQGIWLSADK